MILNKHSPIPQYFQLQTWLIEQIEKGVFKPGDKIPTEKELVELTGLARSTVRHAVQNVILFCCETIRHLNSGRYIPGRIR